MKVYRNFRSDCQTEWDSLSVDMRIHQRVGPALLQYALMSALNPGRGNVWNLITRVDLFCGAQPCLHPVLCR